MCAINPDFFIIDDNAQAHISYLVNDFVESEDVPGMNWLARAPDLSCIEHTWGTLGRAITSNNSTPTTKAYKQRC